jgi:protein Mpv17
LSAAALPALQGLDVSRMLHTSAFGACLVGPVGHFWYLGLDKVAAAWFTPGSFRFIATKVGGAGEHDGPWR